MCVATASDHDLQGLRALASTTTATVMQSCGSPCDGVGPACARARGVGMRVWRVQGAAMATVLGLSLEPRALRVSL